MSRRRQPVRSTWSYAIEAVLAAVVVIALYVFLVSGGPSLFGRVWAQMLGAP
jgi:hypothetical protein